MKPLVQVSNDQSALFGALPAEVSSLRNGSICAANDANFDQSFLSQPLTEYIVGQEDKEDLFTLLQRAAPGIPVARAFTYRTHDSKENFQSDDADDGDIRELGGDFKQVRQTGAQVDGRTDNKGLTMVIDVDQGGLDANVQQRAATNLRQRLARSELARLITLLDANDSAESSVNWGSSNTTADPDADVLSMLENSGDARGIDSNIVLFGGAWIRRLLAHRRSNTPGGYASSAMSDMQLAELYNVDNVVKLRNRKQSTASAKAKILTNDVYCYYVSPGGTQEDPSNVKRFVTGGSLQVYVEQRLKKVLISVEHYSRLVCTSSVGIRKLPTTFT